MATTQMGLDPGNVLTGRVATGQTVKAGTIVTQASAQTDGEPVIVKTCGTSDVPLGVINADGAAGDLVTIFRSAVGPIVCAAGVTFGTDLQLASNGRVTTFSSGRKVGSALTTTVAADTFVRVAFSI